MAKLYALLHSPAHAQVLELACCRHDLLTTDLRDARSRQPELQTAPGWPNRGRLNGASLVGDEDCVRCRTVRHAAQRSRLEPIGERAAVQGERLELSVLCCHVLCCLTLTLNLTLTSVTLTRVTLTRVTLTRVTLT